MSSSNFVYMLDVLKNIMTDEVFQLEIPNSGDDSNDLSNCKGNVNYLQSQDYGVSLETSNNRTSETKESVGSRQSNSNRDLSYKKMSSSQILESFQIGIRNSMDGLAPNPERDILMKDFMDVKLTKFTINDSSSKKSEFVFKTYAPLAFQHFRHLFGIGSPDLVSSLCDAPLLELPNPGASGSIFYISLQDKFITKTVQQKEALFLQKLLPGYYLNLSQNPDTLLPKYFGLYCCNCEFKKVRMIVMNNILPYSTTIHLKYDLKGSKFQRKASGTEIKKASPTYKDLDFLEHHPGGLFLEPMIYTNLIKTLQRDIRVLESFQIIDYSLLVGITFVDKVKKDIFENKELKQELSEEEEYKIKHPQGDNNCLTHKEMSPESTKETHSFDFEKNTLKGIPAKLANGEEVLIFVGVIDILQSYRFKKKIEHVWKSIIHDGDTVSVHNPAFYAKRFEEFLINSVFKSMPHTPKYEKRKYVQK